MSAHPWRPWSERDFKGIRSRRGQGVRFPVPRRPELEELEGRCVPSVSPGGLGPITVSAVSSVYDGNAGVVNDFILFSNGTVYQHQHAISPTDGSPLTQVTGATVDAISAGTDTGGNADVTVMFDSDKSVWTHTGTTQTTGWTKLNSAAVLNGLVPRSFVAGLNGVVDVVFTNNQLWQINLASVGTPTFIAGNVNFAALGVHPAPIALSAEPAVRSANVPADFVAFNDSGSTAGGVWEHYVASSVTHWVSVTSLDAVSISASQDVSDTADLIVSNFGTGNGGIVNHSVWAYRQAVVPTIALSSFTEITSNPALSVSINKASNDFVVFSTDDSMWEHTSPPGGGAWSSLWTGGGFVGVTFVTAPNFSTDVVDVLTTDGSFWQITGLTGTPVYTSVAT